MTRFEALLGAARAACRAGCVGRRRPAQARAALSLWRGEPLADVASELLALAGGPAAGRAAAAGAGDPHRRGPAPGRPRRGNRRAAAPGRRPSAAGAAARPADAGPVPGWPPGRGAGRLPARPPAAGRGTRRRARRRAAGTAPADPDRRCRAWPRPSPARPATGRCCRQLCRAQLPAAVRHFTGRAAELAALTGLLDQAGADSAGDGGDLGDRRDRRGGQDRAGRALGAPGRGPVPRRAAVREPARL